MEPDSAIAHALDGLTPGQQVAVFAPPGPVCVVAGAGSGKTRVLTLRVAHRVATGTASADRILVCTFTRRATTQLAQRLHDLGIPARTPNMGLGTDRPSVHATTLHHLALHLLRRHALDSGRPPPIIADRRLHLARLVGDADIRAVEAEIVWAIARQVTPEDYPESASRERRRLALPFDRVAECFAAYRKSLRRAGSYDLGEIVGQAAEVISADSRFADAVRWRYRHLFVDEIQDVTPAQFGLVKCLLGTNDDLFAVGDPNQSIYGWNGADPCLLASLPGLFDGTVVVRLDDNHRSTPEIVGCAAAALGSEAAGAPSSVRPRGERPVLTSCEDESQEAELVLAEVFQWANEGRPWSDMAVLARTNEQLQCLESRFTQAEVPVSRTASDDEVVKLMTFHQAKGLEWWGVCVVGLEDGLVPLASTTTTEQRAEERRLLYVALTRATDRLVCTWARSRSFAGNRSSDREPSPWLVSLADHCTIANADDRIAPGAPDQRRSSEGTGARGIAGIRAMFNRSTPERTG